MTSLRTLKGCDISYIQQHLGNDYVNYLYKQLKNVKIDEEFIKGICLLAPPFESPTYDQVLKAMKYTDTKSEYKVFDHQSDDFILNPICVGFMYFFRMVHIAAHKIAFRSISMYNRKTMQAVSGRKNNGGQRLGEQECSALIAHDALENLTECLTTKSDCIDLKNQYIKKIIDSNYLKEEEDISRVPEAVNLLKNYLLISGLDMNK